MPVDKEDSLSPTPDIEVVVTALQWDFTYREMRDASVAIRNGADFIGTNSDSTFPTPQGLFPGAGALLASIQAASGEKPLILENHSHFYTRKLSNVWDLSHTKRWALAIASAQTLPEHKLPVPERLCRNGCQQPGRGTGMATCH